MRLSKLALELELGESGEEDGDGGWRRESPLQEVNLGALTFFGQRQDELRVFAGNGGNLVVDLCGNNGAERTRRVCMSQAPDVLNLLLRQLFRLVDINKG